MKAGSTTEEMMTSLLNAEERFQQARTQDIVEEVGFHTSGKHIRHSASLTCIRLSA